MAQIDRLFLMQLFVEIVHLGAFNAAAKKMGITPSKASKNIQQLEKSLGSVLLNRSTRSIGITSAGEQYYKTAMEVLASYEGLIDNLNYVKNRLTGELRISAPELWGNIVLTPLILEFKNKYPNVSIRANFSNDLMDLIQNNTHIAFRSTKLTNEPFLAKKIIEDAAVLCASTKYLQDKKSPTELDDLTEMDFITFSHEVNTYNTLEFVHQGVRQNLTVNGSLSFNSKQPIYEAVLRHHGVAKLPRYQVQQDLAEGTLVEILPDYQIQSLTFYALYTQRRKESTLVATFIDFVQEKYGASDIHTQ